MAISNMFTQSFTKGAGYVLAGSLFASALGAAPAEAAPSAPAVTTTATAMAAVTATVQDRVNGTRVVDRSDCDDTTLCRTGRAGQAIVTRDRSALDVTTQWATGLENLDNVVVIIDGLAGDKVTMRVANNGRMTRQTVTAYDSVETARANGVTANQALVLTGRDIERFSWAQFDNSPYTVWRTVININCDYARLNGDPEVHLDPIDPVVEPEPPVIVQAPAPPPPPPAPTITVEAPPSVDHLEILTVQPWEMRDLQVGNANIDLTQNGQDIVDGPLNVTLVPNTNIEQRRDETPTPVVLQPGLPSVTELDTPYNPVDVQQGNVPNTTSEVVVLETMPTMVALRPDSTFVGEQIPAKDGFALEGGLVAGSDDQAGSATLFYNNGRLNGQLGVTADSAWDDAARLHGQIGLDLLGRRDAVGPGEGRFNLGVGLSGGENVGVGQINNDNFLRPGAGSIVDPATENVVNDVALNTGDLYLRAGVDAFNGRLALNGTYGLMTPIDNTIGVTEAANTRFDDQGAWNGLPINEWTDGSQWGVRASAFLGGDNAAEAPIRAHIGYQNYTLNYDDARTFKICDGCSLEQTLTSSGPEVREVFSAAVQADYSLMNRPGTVEATFSDTTIENTGGMGSTNLEGHSNSGTNWTVRVDQAVTTDGRWGVTAGFAQGDWSQNYAGYDWSQERGTEMSIGLRRDFNNGWRVGGEVYQRNYEGSQTNRDFTVTNFERDETGVRLRATKRVDFGRMFSPVQ